MLITTKEELSQLLPASVRTTPSRLLSLMKQTERSVIIPLVGDELYKYICQAYADQTEDEMDRTLISLLQVPIVYMTLANNAGILSISMNDSGMNVVSADNYDKASKDDREAFVKDCFMNAHKGMEEVLIFLENDSLCFTDNRYTEMWKKSRSYYFQESVIIPTARVFNEFVSINENRETFISFLPRMRYVQENIFVPELSRKLMDAIVRYASTASATIDDADELHHWDDVLIQLRYSLAYFVEADSPKLKRQDSKDEARFCLQRAIAILKKHQNAFTDAIEDAPFYEPPVVEDGEDTTDCKTEYEEENRPTPHDCNYVNGRPDFIHDPFGGFIS